MIDAAVTLLLLFSGHIAGMSGIAGGLYRMQKAISVGVLPLF